MENTSLRPTLRTNRGLLKLILLSLITFGIYPLVVITRIGKEMNIVAAADMQKTMHYCLVIFLLGPITLGIFSLVWWHKISERMGTELRRRQLPYEFSAGTFWGWFFFGSLLFGVGPLVYLYKFCKVSNMLNADFNAKG